MHQMQHQLHWHKLIQMRLLRLSIEYVMDLEVLQKLWHHTDKSTDIQYMLVYVALSLGLQPMASEYKNTLPESEKDTPEYRKLITRWQSCAL